MMGRYFFAVPKSVIKVEVANGDTGPFHHPELKMPSYTPKIANSEKGLWMLGR